MKKLLLVICVLNCLNMASAQPDIVLQETEDTPKEFEVERLPTAEDVIAQLNHPAGKLDLSSPENTVRSFVWALNN